jgi:4-hydroxy-tetrahydrodipicolinate reductase
MIRIVINGAAGRMGRAVIALAAEDANFKVVGAIEAKGHQDTGKDAGVSAGVSPLGILISSDFPGAIGDAEVVIDFSERQSTLSCMESARGAGKAVVIGTTGLSDEDIAQVKKAAQEIPIVLSPNMSIGVNVLFRIAEETAKKLKGYDVEIFEVHHNKKKDAPSGTARKLAQVVAAATGRDLSRDAVYGRQGIVGERKREEIGVLAARAGDVVGEHTVIFAGPGERIELIHRAHSRTTFASGALRAAQFAAAASPGFYSMADVLEMR